VSFTRVHKNLSKHQEIAVAELFRTKFEDDTQRLLKEYYFNTEKFYQPYFSVFQEEAPLVVKENY